MRFFLLIIPLFIFLSPFRSISQHQVKVNINQVIKDLKNHPVGMNVNHLMDDKFLNPPIKTDSSLKNMGIKFLRYPGGEKADNYLWSVPPYDKPRPEAARTGSCEWPNSDLRFANSDYKTFKPLTLDFDEFVAMCKSTGAEPLIVVAYDGMYKSSSCNGIIPTRAQLLKTAEEWVRYANITKKFNIKYWMIGNESYMSCNYNGCATAQQYRDDVIEFSQRMKAVDPTIKIIANGDKSSWWQTVLPNAAKHIDYLGLSNYPIWNFSGGYNYYKNNTPDLIGAVRTASNAIDSHAPSSERSRLKIIVTEYNAIDWSGQWPDNNDLGHALASFEIFGDQVKHPRVEQAHFWNTRWVNNTTQYNDIYDAIDKNGNLNANGLSLSIWGNYLLKEMVSVNNSSPLRNFAVYDKATNKLNVFILNKETSSQSVNLQLDNYISSSKVKITEFRGTGPSDVKPVLVFKDSLSLYSNSMSFTVPAPSITILEFSPQTSSPVVLSPPSVNGASRCGPGTLTLTASGGVNYRWYEQLTGGNILHTGTSFTTPNLTTSKTYYVSNYNGTSESTRTPAIAEIKSIPAEPQVKNAERCGSGTLMLEASGNGTVQWFSNISSTSPQASGNLFTTPSLSQTTTYYASVLKDGCQSEKKPVKATINEIPMAPFANDTTICSGKDAVLFASGTGVEWFNNSTSNSLIGTGNNLILPNLIYSRTVFASSFNGNCKSSRIPVTVYVKEPVAPVVNAPVVCEGETAEIFVSYGSGDNLWYLNYSDNTLIHSGNSFLTDTLFSNYEVFVSHYDGTCESEKIKAEVLVIPLPNKPLISKIESNLLNASVHADKYYWYLDQIHLTDTTKDIQVQTAGNYEVMAFNYPNCASEISDPYSLTVTSLSDNNKELDYYVFPNPSEGVFFLKLNRDYADYKLMVLGNLGQTIWRREGVNYANNIRINLRHLAKGMYFLVIEVDEKIFTEKLIVK
jgi:alpha-L-arabinofuranosidase